MISASALVSTVVFIIIVGVIAGLLNWLMDTLSLSEPYNKVARTVIVVVAVLVIINLLLALVGYPIIK